MNSAHQRVVNICYVAFAVLIATVLFALLSRLSASYDLESKLRSIEFVIRGGSVAIGGLIFFVLFRSRAANEFMNEVVSEFMTKVSWPTQKETTTSTLVVLVTVVIAGFVLGLFDSIWSYILRKLI